MGDFRGCLIRLVFCSGFQSKQIFSKIISKCNAIVTFSLPKISTRHAFLNKAVSSVSSLKRHAPSKQDNSFIVSIVQSSGALPGFWTIVNKSKSTCPPNPFRNIAPTSFTSSAIFILKWITCMKREPCSTSVEVPEGAFQEEPHV